MTEVFVVPHTHWDREWYEPEYRFGQRLVEVVDEVLDTLESYPALRFLLDGQLAIVSDYLRARPEHRARVERLARGGQLVLGPWFVLADELLSGDECLVRNLLVGRRLGRQLGSWMRVGYSPDAFGHPAALPTILRGFSIRFAIVWRGYGGEPGQERDLFRWRGPDGAELITHHLPPMGYEVGAELPVRTTQLAARWQEIRRTLSSRTSAPSWLLLNGADHHAMQSHAEAVFTALGALAGRDTIRVASPAEYFESLPADVGAPVVQGELRFSYRYAWTLQGIHATRSRLKGMVAESERLLVRWAEPQCALAFAAASPAQPPGRPGPVRRPDRRALLSVLWRDHLLSCAHDSVGGCCTDAVARTVTHRAAQVAGGARGVLVDALMDRLGHDRVTARREPDRGLPSCVVVNPSPADRSGVVEVTLVFPQERIVVGRPGPEGGGFAPGSGSPSEVHPAVFGPEGRPIPVQILDRYTGYDRIDSPRDYPRQDVVQAVRAALWVEHVPALGAVPLRVVDGSRQTAAQAGISVVGDEIRGPWCRVNGTSAEGFEITVGTRPADATGFARLESERDGGDTYTFQPVECDRPALADWSPPRAVWGGPLVGVIARDFVIPGRVAGTAYARIDAGSRLLRIAIEGENHSGDHRLRVVFPVRYDGCSVADMQYGPVSRRACQHDPVDFPREWPVATAPMHRYVSVRGPGGDGITVFGRGLFEYEARDDGLAVTLFRAVGELSRGDLPARPGHAGWPSATPEAQERGPFRAELAVGFTAIGESDPPRAWSAMERLAEDFHAPLAGVMVRSMIDPPVARGPRLEGEGFGFKALKPAEREDAIVLRVVNLSRLSTQGSWRWPAPVRRAARADLDEVPVHDIVLQGEGHEIRFDAGPREVVTLLVWP